MTNNKWLIQTILIGLIPILTRLLTWATTEASKVDPLATADFITLGLVIHISILNDLYHTIRHALRPRSYRRAQFGTYQFPGCPILQHWFLHDFHSGRFTRISTVFQTESRMKPLDIYLYIVVAIGGVTSIATWIWLYKDSKKKYPDDETAGKDRPSA